MPEQHDSPEEAGQWPRPLFSSFGLTRVAHRVTILVVIGVTLYAFAGVAANGFVDWDDNFVITENERYRGFDTGHLTWMFTTGFAGHYQPLTWLSFAVDARIWGVNAAGFHVTSLALHVITSVVFLLLSHRLLVAAFPHIAGDGIAVGALAGALLFAIHPLRVESVAWATERRDVLSGMWLTLTVLFYTRAVAAETGPTYRRLFAASLVCYTLSLLSKAAGMTIPIVLLVLDAYPFRRNDIAARTANRTPLSRILWEKVAFAVPATAAALLALWAQGQAGALRSSIDHPLSLRVAQAFYGIAFYIVKTVWPSSLNPLYEQNPEASPWAYANIMSAAIVIAISIVLWRVRRRCPGMAAAWLVYLTLLAPVLGLAQSGPQVVADRYSYLSCMAWAVLMGGGVARLWHTPRMRYPVVIGLVILVGALSLLTKAQVGVWKDSETLWTTVLDRAPRTGTAHANLAALRNSQGQYADARRHSRACLDILPGNRTAHIALARSSAELDDLGTAEQHYEIALTIRPDDPPRLVALAHVKDRMNRPQEAEALYRRVIELDPMSPFGHYNLAGFLANREKLAEAERPLREAARLAPTDPNIWLRLAAVCSALNRPADAVTALETGLLNVPGDVSLSARLAWILATCHDDALRDGRRALSLAQTAARLSDQPGPIVVEAIAAAHAELGDFAAAAAVIDNLLKSSVSSLSEKTIQRLESQRNRYEAGQPARE